MNFVNELFDRIGYVVFATVGFPNLLVPILLLVSVGYSIYKLQPIRIPQSNYFYSFLVGLFLFPLIILSCGIEASTHHLPFDANRSLFVKEVFWVNLAFTLNILFNFFIAIKCAELRMLYISLGSMGLWISFLSWGLSLLFSLNNVFI